MLYYLWIPIAIVMYTTSAYMSVYAKDGWKWIVGLFILQCFSVWPFIAKYSKDLATDGLMFDLFITICFYCTLWYMGQMSSFSISQWIGFGIAIIGMVLMKGIF